MEKKPYIDFQGKRVIVTGASSGIGRAISIELGRCGSSLVLVGRDQERLEETASMIKDADIHKLILDFDNLDDIKPKIQDLSKEVGRIYGLCNAAGIVETRPLSSCKVSHIQSLLNINLIAGIELARIISRRDIMEQEGGAILFISSVYGIMGVPGQVGYCASKGAVSSAARAMAVELARRKIRVNTLSPGLVMTQMTREALALLSKQQVKSIIDKHPLGPGSPEDVARAAAFLLAPQNKWFTGSEIIIDGGYTAQ
jgi:NAD(P)-dependent dehydrogenase (short-subunit alcohol dehydrogenase family)